MLAARGEGALQLTCRLDCQSGTPVTLSIGLFQPSASPQHLRALLQMPLARARITGLVTKVHIAVTASAPLVDRQKRLFADDRPGHGSRPLAGLIDRLTGRLGRQAVVRVRSVPDHQPERACRYEPFVGSTPHRRQTRATDRAFGRLQRPLYLFPRPVPLEVVAVAPEGPPVRFRWTGEPHDVARHWGPERIETAWWRKGPVRRDYYRVETGQGRRYWLFRRLEDGKWFLHGEFG
jgi:protein ImuB